MSGSDAVDGRNDTQKQSTRLPCKLFRKVPARYPAQNLRPREEFEPDQCRPGSVCFPISATVLCAPFAQATLARGHPTDRRRRLSWLIGSLGPLS